MLDSASGQPANWLADDPSAEVHESMRLRKLDSLAILDTPPEPEFDQLIALAAVVCAAPAALMCLADAERLWFKSGYCPSANSLGAEELCGREVAMAPAGPVDEHVIGDALLAAYPELSFYAAAPLVTTDGYVVGALCVLDRRPRTLTGPQEEHLRDLAAQVVSHLECRSRTRLLESELSVKSAELAALRERQRVLDGVLNHTDVLIYAKDLDGRFLMTNPAVERATRILDGRLIGHTDHDFFDKQIADAYRHNDLHIIETRQWQIFDEDLLHADGSRHTYRSTKFPLLDETGAVIGIGGVSTDVTELAAARAAHAEAEQRWRELVEQSLIAVAVTDSDGLVVYANPQAATLCGASSAADIEGRPLVDFAGPGTENALCAMMESILAGGPPMCAQRGRLQQLSGAQIVVEFSATAINYGGGTALQLEVRDVTAAANAQAALRHSASTDALTGLLNRRGWDTALKALLDQESIIALIDLDNFKSYNDAHGHNAGDALLRDFAAAVRSGLRQHDVFARWGGEEFIIALPDTEVDHATHLLDGIRCSVPATQTCSIGFTTWRPPEPFAHALTRADRALYQAKNQGRDRIAGAAAH